MAPPSSPSNPEDHVRRFKGLGGSGHGARAERKPGPERGGGGAGAGGARAARSHGPPRLGRLGRCAAIRRRATPRRALRGGGDDQRGGP